MPAHIKFRKDRKSWYLVDGDLMRSLETTKKGLAQYKLEEYIKDKHGQKPTPTVKEFYDRWITNKIEPLFRRSKIRDYKQHFNAYILPKFKDTRLLAVGTGDLTAFRVELLGRGLSVKTARNIIDSSFRALYRDARAETEELKGRDPFLDIQWPRAKRQKPDPFTPEERQKILAYFLEHEPFYYPWVLLAFMVGTRPSEASALLRSDVAVETCQISINKSRHLGADGDTKTGKSDRTIQVPPSVIEALLTLPSFQIGAERLFINKFGSPLDANQWAKDYWPRILKALDIGQRKFYCTRHTFITEQVKRGELLKAIADYCGTSVTMIEQDYCGTLTLSDRTAEIDQTAVEPAAYKVANFKASPTGFEPVLPA
jgi:integrase